MEWIILTAIFFIGIIILIAKLTDRVSKSMQASNPEPLDWRTIFFTFFILDHFFFPQEDATDSTGYKGYVDSYDHVYDESYDSSYDTHDYDESYDSSYDEYDYDSSSYYDHEDNESYDWSYDDDSSEDY